LHPTIFAVQSRRGLFLKFLEAAIREKIDQEAAMVGDKCSLWLPFFGSGYGDGPIIAQPDQKSPG
jgi:hypothetical protein